MLERRDDVSSRAEQMQQGSEIRRGGRGMDAHDDEEEPDDPGDDGVVDHDDDVAEEDTASARHHEPLDDNIGEDARADPGTAGGRVCGLGDVDCSQLDKRERHGLEDESRQAPPPDGL